VTALRNDEVRLLTRLYFHYESKRSSPDYAEMLRYAERPYLSPEESKAQVDGLLDRGFAEPYFDDYAQRENLRITAGGIEWFERNVDYWRACNEFTFRPLFKDLEPEKPAPSIATRLRDPLVPGAALAGVVATLLIGWFL
jgi:hypothetical protein